MSSIPDLDLDLENLFQPAWAQEKPEANRFEKFTGEKADADRPPAAKAGAARSARRIVRRAARVRRPPRSGAKFGDRKRGFDRRDDRRRTRT